MNRSDVDRLVDIAHDLGYDPALTVPLWGLDVCARLRLGVASQLVELPPYDPEWGWGA